MGPQILYTRLMNETTSMPEVYAVLAMGMDYYDRLELVKIFGAKADAEAYAEVLRESMNEEGDYEGQDPQPQFALVKVERWSVN